MWEKKREPPFNAMRCTIVALTTFLVVAAFNPDRTLHNPSQKLGSNLAWLHLSLDDSLELVSSSSLLILFMTAHPIHDCFSLSSSCDDLLVSNVLLKTYDTSPICMFVLKLKTLKMGKLCRLMYWQPMSFGGTMKGHISLVDPSSEYHNISFSFLPPLSSWMYVEVVDISEKRNLPSHPFLKQDVLWQAECSSNLYLSKSNQMCLFPQNWNFSQAQPFSMWYVKVYAAISNLF